MLHLAANSMKRLIQNSRWLILGVILAWIPWAQSADGPKLGDKAPLFQGVDQDGKPWKLADRIGQRAVVLYFYPKDNTPGCTAQACGLRDQMSDLKKLDTEVVGVSFDSAESHRQFQKQHNLNFTLLTDSDGKIADLYGARRGPGVNMARRVSFLIDKQGQIAHITDTNAAPVHLAEMRTAVKELKN